MSTDVIALVQDRPELAGMFEELGGRLLLRLAVTGTSGGGSADERTTRVYDDSGRLIVFVPEPVLVLVPGEIERLLDTVPPVPPPVWWVEFRAAADVPEAVHLARQGASELVTRYGGMVWAGS